MIYDVGFRLIFLTMFMYNFNLILSRKSGDNSSGAKINGIFERKINTQPKSALVIIGIWDI